MKNCRIHLVTILKHYFGVRIWIHRKLNWYFLSKIIDKSSPLKNQLFQFSSAVRKSFVHSSKRELADTLWLLCKSYNYQLLQKEKQSLQIDEQRNFQSIQFLTLKIRFYKNEWKKLFIKFVTSAVDDITWRWSASFLFTVGRWSNSCY